MDKIGELQARPRVVGGDVHKARGKVNLHHQQEREEAHLRHAGALHLESLDAPVARRDGVDEAVGHDVLADRACHVVAVSARVGPTCLGLGLRLGLGF